MEAEQSRLQHVENLKQELAELRALALKGTAQPSTSSTPQILGPSMYIHNSIGTCLDVVIDGTSE